MSLEGAFVQGEVVSVSGSEFLLRTDDIEPQTAIYTQARFNLDWRLVDEVPFPGIGRIRKGTVIRLGRSLGKTFVPGSTTMFVEGFKNTLDGCVIMCRNLGLNLYKELHPSDYRRKWIINN